jgi:hypothetical protein
MFDSLPLTRCSKVRIALDPGTAFYPCRTVPVTFYFARHEASASGLGGGAI